MIEERINEISIEIGNNCADFYSNDIDFNVIEDGLRQIATEQKAIDNEKACMNFCVACPIYENCDTRYNCPTYEKFEKAIEE